MGPPPANPARRARPTTNPNVGRTTGRAGWSKVRAETRGERESAPRRPVDVSGSDSDAKPVRGIPRAERYAAAGRFLHYFLGTVDWGVGRRKPIRGRCRSHSSDRGHRSSDERLWRRHCGGAGQRAMTQTRSRRAVLRAPSATRLRSLPSAVISRRGEVRGPHPDEVERRPAALADRPEARGFGRRASECNEARGLRDLRRRSRRQSLPLRERKHQHNNQNISQSRPESAGPGEK